MNLHRWMVAGLTACLSLNASTFAHEDDPKGIDPWPPYWGEGYRRANDATRGPAILFPAHNVELLSWLPLSEFNAGTSGNSCWGYVSPSGREYAIMGLRAGTGFVDITDPANAQIVAVIPTVSSLWHDVKVWQDHCYVVSEGGFGIQVISMAQIDAGIVTVVNDIDDVGTGRTHTVAIDTTSGFLYRAGGPNNGLRVYSLANPANPTFVGQWQTRYVHEAQVVTYSSGIYAGKQIAFCFTGFNGGANQ